MMIADLSRRIEQLERQNRLLRLLFCILLLAVALTVLMGQADRRVVQAEEFTLVNAAGQMRAAMWVTEDGLPCLKMVDNQDVGRVGLFIRGDGIPALQLHDTAGTLRAAVMLEDGNNPAFELYDAQGQERVVLDMDAEGEAVLDLIDANKRLRLAMGLMGGEFPGFVLYDQDGEALFVAP